MARLLCLLTALMVVDGHLLVGQAVAWLTMIHDQWQTAVPSPPPWLG